MDRAPGRLQPGGGARWALPVVLVVSLLLNAVPFWWGLPAERTWAFDEIRPAQVDHPEYWPEKYPPLHRYVLGILFRAISPLRAERHPQSQQEPVDLVALRGAQLAAARSLSVLLSVATVALVYFAARRAALRRAGALLAALALALSPVFVYYAKTANLEAPYVFWFALSLLFYLRGLESGKAIDLVLFGAAAACAVTTKDQAYGLYLLAPVGLVLGRAARLERPLDVWKERGLYLGLVAAAVAFLVIHRIPWDPTEFREHVRVMTGEETHQYRTAPATLGGQLRLADLAVRHIGFVLGWPLFALAAAGVWVAVRYRAGRLLSTLLLPIGYYLGFVAVIGFHYDRFFLPVAVVLALSCGLGGQALWDAADSPGKRRFVVAGLIVALSFALLRALAIDGAMLRDPRYAAEAWLAAASEELPSDERPPALGVGREAMLPRGLSLASWSKVQHDRCSFLRKRAPRHLVLSPADAWGPNEQRFVAALDAGDLPYEIVHESRRDRLDRLSEVVLGSGVESNLSKVGPPIRIFARTGGECFDARSVSRRLDELLAAPSPSERETLIAAIGRLHSKDRMSLGEGAEAVGLEFDGWTRGTAPAALVVEAVGESSGTPRLRLRTMAPESLRPYRVWIDDGETRRAVVFDHKDEYAADLAPLAPGERRLIVVWAESAWSPGDRDGRALGVRIEAVERSADLGAGTVGEISARPSIGRSALRAAKVDTEGGRDVES